MTERVRFLAPAGLGAGLGRVDLRPLLRGVLAAVRQDGETWRIEDQENEATAMDIEDQRSNGRQILKEVIGAAYLERRDASTNDFNRPLREFSETYAFGDIWSRPGLPRKVRSMLCMAMLTAMGKPAELRLHVNSAINNGCTVEEIQEVLYQTVAYCGIPATIEAFKVAEEVLAERGVEMPKR
jgi:4-carboxymuconolactone decarboxylase